MVVVKDSTTEHKQAISRQGCRSMVAAIALNKKLVKAKRFFNARETLTTCRRSNYSLEFGDERNTTP